MLRILITLGFVALATGVVALSFFVGAESSWGGLWLNLGTEIIGIALTVAIVEWLFERRATRRAHRHETITSLASQLRLAVTSRDRIYAFELLDWGNLCGELRDRLPRRRGSLKPDEMRAVSHALTQSEKTLALAREISDYRRQASGWRDLLEDAIDRRDDELKKLGETLVAASSDPSSADIGTVRAEVQRVASMLSRKAEALVTTMVKSNRLDISALDEIIQSEERIRLYDWIFLARFAREVGWDWSQQDFEDADEHFEQLQEKANDELASKDVPSTISQLANTYMMHERAAIAKRAQYELEVRALDELVNKAQHNIFEETPLD